MGEVPLYFRSSLPRPVAPLCLSAVASRWAYRSRGGPFFPDAGLFALRWAHPIYSRSCEEALLRPSVRPSEAGFSYTMPEAILALTAMPDSGLGCQVAVLRITGVPHSQETATPPGATIGP